MRITQKNLIKNLDKIGGWSLYGLAETAAIHYSPELLDKDDECVPPGRLAEKYNNWQELVTKYHNEVGYTKKELNKEAVNEY